MEKPQKQYAKLKKKKPDTKYKCIQCICTKNCTNHCTNMKLLEKGKSLEIEGRSLLIWGWVWDID